MTKGSRRLLITKYVIIGTCLSTFYSLWIIVLSGSRTYTTNPCEIMLLVPCLPGFALAALTGTAGPYAGDYLEHAMVSGNAIFYGAIGALIGYWRSRPIGLPGHCQFCHYDLTGNASGICPECGKAISKET